jgi:eukaryotic-like serine/threonine-protein kinase
MGVVWAARDERDGQSVALKILATHEPMAPDSRKRFLREAYATRSIQHAAIVPVTEVLETDELVVLAMERLIGETLRPLLNRAAQLSVAHAATLLTPIAEALDAAHRAGIVHRDLKPENIFLQSVDGQVRPRLLDFGIARFYEPPPAAGRTPITGMGTLLGTISYMAPEQALSAADADQLVDAWALGVMLYEALGGCRPIEGNTPHETLRQLLIGAITPISVLVPGLPDGIDRLVMGLLNRERNSRTTCRTAAQQLAGMRGG